MSKYTERPSISMCANHGDYQRQLIAWQKSKIEGLENTNLEMLEMLKVVDRLYQAHASRSPDEIPLHQVNDAKYTYGDARKIRALITKIESE